MSRAARSTTAATQAIARPARSGTSPAGLRRRQVEAERPDPVAGQGFGKGDEARSVPVSAGAVGEREERGGASRGPDFVQSSADRARAAVR